MNGKITKQMENDYYPERSDVERLLMRAARAESALKDAELEALRGGASTIILGLIVYGLVAFTIALFIPSISALLPEGASELGGIAFVLLLAALGFYFRNLSMRRQASRMVYFAIQDLKQAQERVILLKK